MKRMHYVAVYCDEFIRDAQLYTDAYNDDMMLDDEHWVDMKRPEVLIGVFTVKSRWSKKAIIAAREKLHQNLAAKHGVSVSAIEVRLLALDTPYQNVHQKVNNWFHWSVAPAIGKAALKVFPNKTGQKIFSKTFPF